MSLQDVIVDHALARLAGLPGTAPAHALHVYLPRMVGNLVKGVAVPVHGLEGRVTGLASCALAPRTVRGVVDEGALAVTCHALLLLVYGLDDPGIVECACALEATVRGHSDCARSHLAVARPGLTALSHGRGVGGLDEVAGIARRLLLLPAIAATLG